MSRCGDIASLMSTVDSKEYTQSPHWPFAAVFCRLLHQELEPVSPSFASSVVNCLDPQRTANHTLPHASLNLQCVSMHSTLQLWTLACDQAWASLLHKERCHPPGSSEAWAGPAEINCAYLITTSQLTRAPE